MKLITMKIYNGDYLQFEKVLFEPMQYSVGGIISWTYIRMFHGKRPIKTIHRQEHQGKFLGIDLNYHAVIRHGEHGWELVSLRVPWLEYP